MYTEQTYYPRLTQMCFWVAILLLALIPNPLEAQNTSDFEGQWQGELTQVEGGFADEYVFEIFISVEGDEVSGRSYVRASGVEGVMQLSGPIRGKTCYLKEFDILRSKKPNNMAWCMKSMQLRLIKRGEEWWLEGPWQGNSDYGLCPPGMIRLKKVVPRV